MRKNKTNIKSLKINIRITAKNLKDRNIMYGLKKLTRLHWVLTMVKECNQ